MILDMNVDLETYNKVFNSHIINLNRVLSNVNALSHEIGIRTLVDVGGHYGCVSEPFRAMYDKVYVIDNNIKNCTDENTECINGDMRDMGYMFEKESVDVFLFHASMHHCPDDIPWLFSDMHRLLKKNGMVIIMEPNRFHPFTFVLRKICESDMHDDDERPFSIKQLYKYIYKDEWIVCEKRFFHFFTYLLPWIVPRMGIRAQKSIKKMLNVLLCADEILLKTRIFQPFCGYMMVVLQKK